MRVNFGSRKLYAHLTTKTLQKASGSISGQLMRAAEAEKERIVIPSDKASGQ